MKLILQLRHLNEFRDAATPQPGGESFAVLVTGAAPAEWLECVSCWAVPHSRLTFLPLPEGVSGALVAGPDLPHSLEAIREQILNQHP
ncbi:MAG: hypothetical protein KDA96_06585, partial [Planctomycetaceae bacterium]|nr:hypothetical protein [Planctomycetaceae bacterium]